MLMTMLFFCMFSFVNAAGMPAAGCSHQIPSVCQSVKKYIALERG